MRPRRYPYSGKKKELVKPVQIENPLTLFNQFIMSVLYNAKPNNSDHIQLVIELMQTYSQLYS